jgi:hypothetical protein
MSSRALLLHLFGVQFENAKCRCYNIYMWHAVARLRSVYGRTPLHIITTDQMQYLSHLAKCFNLRHPNNLCTLKKTYVYCLYLGFASRHCSTQVICLRYCCRVLLPMSCPSCSIRHLTGSYNTAHVTMSPCAYYCGHSSVRVGFEVFTAVTANNAVFRDVASCAFLQADVSEESVA